MRPVRGGMRMPGRVGGRPAALQRAGEGAVLKELPVRGRRQPAQFGELALLGALPGSPQDVSVEGRAVTVTYGG
jgi:hypothetical protein